jgi:hypothetical protein
VPVSQAQASWITRRGVPERRTGPDVRFPASTIVDLSSPNVVSDALHRDWYTPRSALARLPGGLAGW